MSRFYKYPLTLLALILFALFIYLVVITMNMQFGSCPKRYSAAKLREVRKRFPHDVDLVYTWVDGHDDERNALRARTKYALENGGELPEGNAAAGNRFHNYNELRYAIRSVEMYVPWIRKIFILGSGRQVPDFLKMDNRLQMVYEEDLAGEHGKRPTFNSHAIECAVHRIPGLAERFLYACDDMFFTKALEPEYFFPEDDKFRLFQHAIVWTGRPDPDGNADLHDKAWGNNNVLLDKHCGKEQRKYPAHQVTAMTITAMREAEQTFAADWHATEKRPFRNKQDIHPFGLAQYLAAHRGLAEWSTGEAFYIAPISDNRLANAFFFSSMIMHTNDLKCINDHSSHDSKGVERQVKRVLERMFPDPSQYEK